MAVGKDIETRGHVTGFREEIARAAAASEDAFHTWFNTGVTKDEAFVRGTWDFMHHVAGAGLAVPVRAAPDDRARDRPRRRTPDGRSGA
jgi:hypothetical protein